MDQVSKQVGWGLMFVGLGGVRTTTDNLQLVIP